MKRFAQLFDYVFVLRPTLFFPVWTVFAAGCLVDRSSVDDALNGTNGHDGMSVLFQSPILVAGLLTLLMGGVFVLNQLHDIETDRRNNKLFLIAHGHISQLAAQVESILLIVIALAAATVIQMELGALFFAIFLLTGLFYSCSPFRMKDRPWLGLAANSLGACLVFAAGLGATAGSGKDFFAQALHSTPYMAAVGAVYLYTTLLDVEGDRLTDKITFGVKFGVTATTIAGAALVIVAVATAWWLDDMLMFYPALISMPFFVVAAVRKKIGDVQRAIKLPILFLAVAVCVEVIEYLLLLVFVYYFSKWYYLKRFGIEYPSLASRMPAKSE
jgi:4-hydroxybenzoate polyprenyltransferase